MATRSRARFRARSSACPHCLAAPTLASSSRALEDVALAPGERRQLDGTFVLKPDRVSSDLHDSYAQYRRTFRVFDENGHLMIQTLGEGPEQLLKQTRWKLCATLGAAKQSDDRRRERQRGAAQDRFAVAAAVGARVGPGNPTTFHAQLR